MDSTTPETSKRVLGSNVDVNLSDTDSQDSFDSSSDHSNNGDTHKKKKLKFSEVVLPHGFLDPLPALHVLPLNSSQPPPVVKNYKQFWKAGDYEVPRSSSSVSSGGLDHVRVHPRFLHSNATSHKWALGAFAELFDNAVDEICRGATYINVDMLANKKDGSKMLLVEDNGGGMNVDTMRHCMSFGYSAKSKVANTIGQYGNGFKTSTMRLGADVIMFSRFAGTNGEKPTQSIGLLSYTFLRSTGKDDIVVPIIDYEKGGSSWNKMIRSTLRDWNNNLDTIVHWSPFSSEAELLHQFTTIKHQGTRLIIYNLWEDDQGELELDVDTDPQDIQLRGINRDETKIAMANNFPNSRHFLTYQHSLRSYTAILYLRLPPAFRIILRGKDVDHHNIVNDMMFVKKLSYRPVGADGAQKDSNLLANVTIGFVKDAKDHIDVQGFNVYHKNRLIKPFWRVWNAAGSDGRGVIGVLEANFIKPAHDKQGFENTIVLQRLHQRLQIIQKEYWRSKCHEIGYAPRCKGTRIESSNSKEKSPMPVGKISLSSNKEKKPTNVSKRPLHSALSENCDQYAISSQSEETNMSSNGNQSTGPDLDVQIRSENQQLKDRLKTMNEQYTQNLSAEKEKSKMLEVQSSLQSSKSNSTILDENNHINERLKQMEESFSFDLQIEREKCRSLEDKLKEKEHKIKELDEETDQLIEIFSEERTRRDNVEENLRKKIKEASTVIEELREKIALLEKMDPRVCKQEH